MTVKIIKDALYRRQGPKDPRYRFFVQNEEYGWTVNVDRYVLEETKQPLYKGLIISERMEVYGLTINEVMNEIAAMLEDRIGQWDAEGSSRVSFSRIRSHLSPDDAERIEQGFDRNQSSGPFSFFRK